MGIDHKEAQRRRKVDTHKHSSMHPIAAIQKRVIGSQAFADTAFSSRAVLLLLASNQELDLNGHIQLSEKQAAENGIERKTLRRAFADLLAHQLIAMTWRGGKVQGQCNKYALTWMPIKEHKGIHTKHFKLDAWRDWKPSESNKTGCRKCPLDRPQNVPLKAISSPKMSPTPGDKKGPIELNTNTRYETVFKETGRWQKNEPTEPWIPDYFAQLEASGLSGAQCFQIPQGRALQ